MIKREELKSYNRSAVMEIIRKNEVVFRAELARQTGLSIPTIMKITDEFIRSGLIKETGKGESSGGKPPVLYELIPNARLFIGVDISGRKMKCIIMNLRGGVVFQHIVPKKVLTQEGTTVDKIISFVEETITLSKVKRNKLCGIGVGLPGLVDTKRNVVIASIDFDWRDYDLHTPLEAHFNLPVYLENSSKVMAMGEKWFGKGQECNDFGVITVGRGIGAALIVDGDIYKGFYNMSGEIGHMVIDPRGDLCKCGRRGCLETFASEKAISQKAQRMAEESPETLMLKIAKDKITDIDSDVVFAAAKEGDAIAKRIVDEVVDVLSTGILNFIGLFDFKLIILSGCVVKDNNFLVKKVEENVNNTRALYFGDTKVSLKISQLGEDAAVIGAATLPLKRLVADGDSQST